MGKQRFLQKECKVNLKFDFEVIYLHNKNKMELADKLHRDWFRAGQLKDREAVGPAIDKCIKDIKDNGPAYLDILSKCNCCERHQTDRPSNINELKEYPNKGESSVDKHMNMWADGICQCICRHYCRRIVLWRSQDSQSSSK